MEQIAVGSKRSHADRGPDKKKPKLKVVASAIQNALSKAADGESSKNGLLAYFSKGTAEDRANFFAREDERFEQTRSQSIADTKDMDAKKKLHKRERAKLRQQKHRQIQREKEVQNGTRSPGGRKRKVRH